MPSRRSIEGEMKATASPRSRSRGDRPGAGGRAAASCTGASTDFVMLTSQPAAAVEDGLLLPGDVVERRLRVLGPVEGRVDVGVLDVDEAGVLRDVPHVPLARDGVRVDLVERSGLEELGGRQGVGA